MKPRMPLQQRADGALNALLLGLPEFDLPSHGLLRTCACGPLRSTSIAVCAVRTACSHSMDDGREGRGIDTAFVADSRPLLRLRAQETQMRAIAPRTKLNELRHGVARQEKS
jgi:hypothetical protein